MILAQPRSRADITPNDAQRDALMAQRELSDHRAVFASLEPEQIGRAAHAISRVFLAGGRVYLCGNGGSASSAQHIATELNLRVEIPKPVLAFSDFASLTAIGADVGFDHVFEVQAARWLEPGDCLWVFSTSGQTDNICLALSVAFQRGCERIGMVPERSRAAAQCSYVIAARGTDPSRVQEAHLAAAHVVCSLVRQLLAEKAREI